MFNRILVPVDMSHADKLTKALGIAGAMAKTQDAEACYVAVTASAPGAAAHSPEELADKLGALAKREGEAYGIRTAAKVIECHDPAVELHEELLKAIEETGADAVVMASHIPDVPDHFFSSSHAGYVARHAPVSVFVVR